MTNSIEARVEFSYRGEAYAPGATIDLDACMSAAGRLGDLHPVIARMNNIDTYSYLYEVMESHEITFANATGLAAECMTDGVFDMAAFERRWQQARQYAVLGPIARRHLNIDHLEQHPDVLNALLEAYNAGRSAPVA